MPGPPLHRLEIRTSRAEELVDVTARVRDVVRASGVTRGLVTVASLHTTAAVTVQENTDPVLHDDILEALDRTAPRVHRFRHAEGNAHAHVKAALLGSSQTLILEGGELLLGTWQGIYLVELDGPRRRTLAVKILPDP